MEKSVDEVFRATVPPALTWGSQVVQYPTYGPPGIGYYAGDVSEANPDWPPVDCLLYRNDAGRVVAILNHYPVDMPPWEQAGNVNVWTAPGWQRRGLATALWCAAKRQWPQIELRAQRFTVQGVKLAESLVGRGLA